MSSAETERLDDGELTTQISTEENEPLLKTKLFVPAVQSNCVPRSRLFQQIQNCQDKALTLVIAPAGYGKTTLVSSWLRETHIPSTWLSLDEDDNDPARFLEYLIAALHKIVPAVQRNLLGVLQGRQPAHYLALMNIIINEISEHAEPFILVLDDFHTLQSQPILDLFIHLIEHIPPEMHILLLSRMDPLFPISRLRAHNQLIDIRADHLRFSREEVDQFLNDVMALKLSRDDILALESRTEGWIAGLQLAAISMLAGKDVHSFVSAFTGSHYYIMDYLVEEVLKLQTEPVRLFLLQTSILDRMCGLLCDSVVFGDGIVEGVSTGADHGQAMLESLERMNLFIIPLDSERRWYRYHHLFADVLKRRLEQLYAALLPDLHHRASRWYEQNGYTFDAIRHSLLAGEKDRAAQLLDQNGCVLLMRGEVITLLHWIEAVEPYSQTLPWIAIQKGWALCLTGQLDRAEGPLQTAEQLIGSLAPSDEVRTMLGAVTAARAYRANMQGEARLAANFARQALDYLPAYSDFSCSLRSAATSILGDACWIDGHLAEAQRAYADAVLISQAAGNIHMIIIANDNLADILIEQGQIQQAARIYAQMLQVAVLPDGHVSPLIVRVLAGLSRVAYECNHLEDAAKYIRQCIENSQRWGSIEFQVIGLVMLAELEQAACHSEKSLEAMHAAEQLVNESPLPSWRSIWIQSTLARLWIAQGYLEKAACLVKQSGICVDGIPADGTLPYLQEPLYLILLRLHLAQGDYDAALALSAWLLQMLDENRRASRVIETLVLRALAFQGKRENDQALVVIDRAISLAYPEWYVRIFLDEGEPMAKLLYQARLHQPGKGYAAELLSAIGNTIPRAQLLIEPLTERELQVLQLIEAGYTNQEIAVKFVISLPTVKRHISNIYAKLGVNSRTQAVSRGKELDLFK